MRRELPEYASREIEQRARYRLRLDTPLGPVSYRRSRWEHLNEGPDQPKLWVRDSAAWLYRGDERAALMIVQEYRTDGEPLYWDEFVRLSGMSAALAKAIADSLSRRRWGIARLIATPPAVQPPPPQAPPRTRPS